MPEVDAIESQVLSAAEPAQALPAPQLLAGRDQRPVTLSLLANTAVPAMERLTRRRAFGT